MRKFLWILTFIGSILGGLRALYAFLFIQSWTDQATVTVMGIAFAVIPYCLARAASEMAKEESEEKKVSGTNGV